MKIITIAVIFLLLGAFFIVTKENLYLNSTSSFDRLGDEYYSWLNSLFENAKLVTGYVIKLDWLPENESSSGE